MWTWITEDAGEADRVLREILARCSSATRTACATGSASGRRGSALSSSRATLKRAASACTSGRSATSRGIELAATALLPAVEA